MHLRCDVHELASAIKEAALKILELTNRLFEERIVVSDTPTTPTSWIAVSDEQGQIVSDTPAHECHFG
jgi:gamma-glutamyltranspeptidase